MGHAVFIEDVLAPLVTPPPIGALQGLGLQSSGASTGGVFFV